MKQAIFGYGGHAREVAMQIGGEVTFFVDDEYSNDIAKPISEFNVLEYEILVAVANPREREEIVNRLPPQTEFTTFIHPTANIGDNVYLGTNSSIREKLSISSNTLIGLNGGVVKNITEGGIYVGTPCKKIKNEDTYIL